MKFDIRRRNGKVGGVEPQCGIVDLVMLVLCEYFGLRAKLMLLSCTL